MAVLPKGFDVLIDMHTRLNQPTYTTSEIIDEFTRLEKTRGVGSGTINRALEHGLLTRHGYGVYSVNLPYPANTNMTTGSSVKSILKNCVESVVQDINNNFPISTVVTMNHDDVDILKKTISSLQQIIDELS